MSDTTHTVKNHPLDIETFTIKPTDMYRVPLGIFSDTNPEPRFRLIYHRHDIEQPNIVTHHDVSIPRGGGTYELHRQFQSYSQIAHVITVRFAAPKDKALCLEGDR